MQNILIWNLFAPDFSLWMSCILELAHLFHQSEILTFNIEKQVYLHIFTRERVKTAINQFFASISIIFFNFEWTKKKLGVQQDHLWLIYLPCYNVLNGLVKTHSTYSIFSNWWFYDHFVSIRVLINTFQNIFGLWKVEVGEKVAALTFLQWVMRKMATMIFWKKNFYERWKTKSPPNVLITLFMKFCDYLFSFFLKKKFWDFRVNIGDLDLFKKLETTKKLRWKVIIFNADLESPLEIV